LLLALPYLLLAVYAVYPDFYSVFHGLRIETVADMEHQAKVSPQEPDGFFNDSASIASVPLNSVPAGKFRYPFEQAEYDSATVLVNPLPANDYILARGKNRFQTFCVPCHGNDGEGQGLIITKPELDEDEEGFPPPADLTSRHTKELTDGRLFHILSAGQNLMFPVNFKMNVTDRWALVLYIRKLQK